MGVICKEARDYKDPAQNAIIARGDEENDNEPRVGLVLFTN